MKSRTLAALSSVLIAAAQAQAVAATTSSDISSITPPVHPCTEAQVREYLTLSHAAENARKLIMQNLHNERAVSSPYLTPAFWEDMEKAGAKIDFIPLAVPAYQKYLSQEDMAAIIAFYRTPAGRRILAAQPFVESIVADAARKAGEQAGIEVGKKHEAEIRGLMQQQQAPQRNQSQPFEVFPAN